MVGRALAALALALAAATASGCRSDEELAPADLSSASLYCPPRPPMGDEYTCEPTAIPYCTYPDLQITCTCEVVARGRHALVCPVDLGTTD